MKSIKDLFIMLTLLFLVACGGDSGTGETFDQINEFSSDEEIVFSSESEIIFLAETEKLSSSASYVGVSSSSVVRDLMDARDGHAYRTVTIDNQKWMAENLNFAAVGSTCYNDDEAYCISYGRLYTWESAQHACPSGWRLPSAEDFRMLLKFVGESDNLRGKLWYDETIGGEDIDKYNFSVLPAGIYSPDDEEYRSLGLYTSFWSATESYDEDLAYALNFDYFSAGVYYSNKLILSSVRCIENSIEESSSSIGNDETESSSSALTVLLDERDNQSYETVVIGSQTWMAENLNYEIKDGVQSWCYENSSGYCEIFGRLYTWAAAVGKLESECGLGNECGLSDEVQGVCPDGWHLPSEKEWKVLLSYSGDAPSYNLRSDISWQSSGGRNIFGFSALAAGMGMLNGKNFFDMERYANFWSSSEYGADEAFYVGLPYHRVYALKAPVSKDYAYSVRCVQNVN